MQTTRFVDLSLCNGFTRRRLLQGLAGLAGVTTTLHAEAAFTATEINHINLNVADLKKSEEFYAKLFGPAVERSAAGPVNFEFDPNQQVMLSADSSRRIGVDHFCLSVEGYALEATAAKMKQNGISPEYPYGPRALYVRDPDGILIQLERPAYHNNSVFQRVVFSRPTPQALFKPVALDHVTLQVSNLDKTTAFYEKLFGPAVRGTKNNASIFAGTGQDLTWTTSGPGLGPIGVDHFCIAIERYEPDEVTKKLREAGIASQRLNEPDQVYFRDPDGILVQLAQDGRARRQSSGRK